jgi:hypothetical protein
VTCDCFSLLKAAWVRTRWRPDRGPRSHWRRGPLSMPAWGSKRANCIVHESLLSLSLSPGTRHKQAQVLLCAGSTWGSSAHLPLQHIVPSRWRHMPCVVPCCAARAGRPTLAATPQVPLGTQMSGTQSLHAPAYRQAPPSCPLSPARKQLRAQMCVSTTTPPRTVAVGHCSWDRPWLRHCQAHDRSHSRHASGRAGNDAGSPGGDRAFVGVHSGYGVAAIVQHQRDLCHGGRARGV